MALNTPVLFVVFNRPETTKRVFEEIKKAEPKELYLAADGPRLGNERDKLNCTKVREIVQKVDWPCKVKKRFIKENLGCKIAESSAIKWFFENVSEGIIIEDDDLPNQSFFKFCEGMLKKYRNDDRIMHISGNNFQRGWKRDNYSYYFSNYVYIWGFATWKRAWEKYDINTKLYPEIKKKKYLLDAYNSIFRTKVLEENLDSTYYKNFNTWDYQWAFALAVNNGLSVVPNENLITNIGMTSSAVHTSSTLDKEFSLPTRELRFPLKHPPFMIRDVKSDNRYFKWLFSKKIRNYFLKKTGLIRFFRVKK